MKTASGMRELGPGVATNDLNPRLHLASLKRECAKRWNPDRKGPATSKLSNFVGLLTQKKTGSLMIRRDKSSENRHDLPFSA